MNVGHGPPGNGDRPPGTAPRTAARPAWLRRHVTVLVVLDAVAVTVAATIARVWTFGLDAADLQVRSITIPYSVLAVGFVPAWLALLAVVGSYDIGPFGAPSGEYGRVVRAGAYFLAVVAVAYFVLHLEDLARGFLVAIVPSAVLLTLALRAAAAWHRARQRAQGRTVRRAVVVGSRRSVGDVVHRLHAHPACGVVVVGACVPGPAEPVLAQAVTVPVLGGTGAVLPALERSGADTVVFTGSLALGRVRTLAWTLEGSGIDVFVVPALAQSPAQYDVRPAAGLPLLFVEGSSGTPARPGSHRPAASS